jgi:hypothetical protein
MKNFLGKIMKSDTQAKPLEFAGRFLQLHGAAIEQHGPLVEALIPEELRILLDAPEHIRISEDITSASETGKDFLVTYGAPILERMIGAALEKIPLAGCGLEFDYVKGGGFDRLIDEQLTFYGAVAAVETVAEVTAEYVFVACRYTAQSDEQKEGLLTMAFNADTGGFVPEMTELLDTAGCRSVFTVPAAAARDTILSLADHVEQTARRLVADQLEPFRTSMNRRFKRDIANLNEYYQSLEQEMQNSLEKSGLSESARSDRQTKIKAIPAELASKSDDLFKKYSIKVRLQPTAAMHIRTPAKKIVCRLSIGRQTRQFFFTYNPVARKLDPPSCTRCRKSISHIHFNDRLEPVCFGCRD